MSKVTEYLQSMERDIARTDCWTQEQAEEWASHYWAVMHDKSLPEEEMKDKIAAMYGEAKPVRKVSIDEHGNTVIRRFWSTERYEFDFDDDFRKDGWLQFDTNQDAWYFGVWVNPKTFRTLTYAEGDVILTVCPDAEHYNAEVKSACEFYGEGFEYIACNVEGFQQVLLGGKVEGAEGMVAMPPRLLRLQEDLGEGRRLSGSIEVIGDRLA